MNYDPPYINSNIFNTRYFTDLDDSLTLAAADLRYLKLSGGVVYGLTTFSNSLNVIGTLSINGSAIDLSLISGVTAGTPQASKALSLNSSSQIDGNLQFATSRKILMNNSSSQLAYIDMGNQASDRCISLFSDAASYYGFGANLSNLRSFSKDSFAWYTGASQSVIGTSIMTLNSAGLLTIASLTATSITGTLQTAAQPNITSVATLDITTHDGSSVGLKLGGVLVSATAAELNYNTDVVAGTVLASSSVVVDSNKDITGFRRLSVGGTTGIMQINALTGGDAAIRLGSSEAVNKCWTIQYLTATNLLRFDAFGSNSSMTLTPAGDLTSKASFDTLAYKLNGVAITMSALTSITLGTAAASKALTLDASSNITGIVGLSATNLTGTLQTAAQPNITSIGTLASLTATNITGTLQTAAQPNITSIGTLASLTATNITGTLQTAAQPNITSLGSLTALTTSSLTLGATAITATGTELNVLAGITPGAVLASKAIVVDVNKDISTIRNMSVSGIITMSASTTTLQMNVPASNTRSNFIWNTDSNNFQYELGVRGSAAGGPNNAMYFYRGGYSMCIYSNGFMTMGGIITPPSRQLEINSGTGVNLRLTYNATSNLCDFLMSSTGVLTIAPSGSVTAISGTTGSTSNTTGALTLSGGIGISLTTDATSISNGGSFTTAGGMAIAKSVWCGGTITVNKSTSSSLFAGYSGTSNFTVSGLLNSDITIGTGSSNNLNIMTGNTTAMTIDGFTQNISGISSLSANFLTANSLTGTCATAAQPFITSLGVLTALSISGTLTLGGTAITASAAELNYCDLAGSAGTAEANKVMTLDASKNIATVNRITSNYLTINTAINASSCIASLLKVDLNNISTAYGLFSAKASSSYLSPYFGSSNSMFWAENANASVIEFEINVSNGAMSTSTNPVRMGTCTANDFSLFTAATERLLIRSGGAVAIKNYLQIGDSVDTTRMLSILDNTMTSGTSRYLTLGKSNNTGNQAEISFIWVGNNDNTNALTFGFHGGEKCRLSKYGSFLINSTSYTYGGNSTRFAVNTDGTVDWAGIMKNTANSSSKMFGFMSWNDVEQGSIQFGTGSTSYNTSSDYRLKKDIKPMLNGLELINRLRPVRFKWKNNDIESDGFIAHELQEVIPCVVVGKKDALYPNGSINPQAADYGKITPYLTAAVKELTDINIALSKKIEDLESKVKNILSYDDLNKHIKLITKQVLKDYTVE
jgi:hypothetical protein